LNEMSKIATAFIWSLFLSLLAGLIAWGLLFWLEFPWWIYPAMTMGLTIISAWIDSRELLAHRLGRRYEPSIQVSGRAIPVSAGGLATVFEAILPGKRRSEIEVENELSIMTPTGLLIREDRIAYFLNRAYTRQIRGLPGLSRPYWTRDHRPPFDRSEYDSLIYCLMGGGFIDGRVQGRSGKLNTHYKEILLTMKRTS